MAEDSFRRLCKTMVKAEFWPELVEGQGRALAQNRLPCKCSLRPLCSAQEYLMDCMNTQLTIFVFWLTMCCMTIGPIIKYCWPVVIPIVLM